MTVKYFYFSYSFLHQIEYRRIQKCAVTTCKDMKLDPYELKKWGVLQVRSNTFRLKNIFVFIYTTFLNISNSPSYHNQPVHNMMLWSFEVLIWTNNSKDIFSFSRWDKCNFLCLLLYLYSSKIYIWNHQSRPPCITTLSALYNHDQ